MMLRYHVQTGGVTLTAQQPLNNIVRVGLQAYAAALGGCQSLHTNSYDEALCLPTQDAVTVALRTQQIVAEESGAALTAASLRAAKEAGATTSIDLNYRAKLWATLGGLEKGQEIFRRILRLPTNVEYAHELRYADPILGPNELAIAISQSGETADTLAAARLASAHGSRLMAITKA